MNVYEIIGKTLTVLLLFACAIFNTIIFIAGGVYLFPHLHDPWLTLFILYALAAGSLPSMLLAFKLGLGE